MSANLRYNWQNGFWTDERTQTLKALWDSGISASDIAKELNCASRSAVIGKVHRLGLPGRVAKMRSDLALKPKRNSAKDRTNRSRGASNNNMLRRMKIDRGGHWHDVLFNADQPPPEPVAAKGWASHLAVVQTARLPALWLRGG